MPFSSSDLRQEAAFWTPDRTPTQIAYRTPQTSKSQSNFQANADMSPSNTSEWSASPLSPPNQNNDPRSEAIKKVCKTGWPCRSFAIELSNTLKIMKRLKIEYDDLGIYLKELENHRPSRKPSKNEWQEHHEIGIRVSEKECLLAHQR